MPLNVVTIPAILNLNISDEAAWVCCASSKAWQGNRWNEVFRSVRPSASRTKLTLCQESCLPCEGCRIKPDLSAKIESCFSLDFVLRTMSVLISSVFSGLIVWSMVLFLSGSLSNNSFGIVTTSFGSLNLGRLSRCGDFSDGDSSGFFVLARGRK